MTAELEFALFDPSGFPVRPAAQHEQSVLPIPTTLTGEYAAWRATALGQHLYDLIRYRALAAVRAGEARVGIKALFEWARSTHKVSLDNSFTPLLARELLDREPELRGAIECRQRVAI